MGQALTQPTTRLASLPRPRDALPAQRTAALAARLQQDPIFMLRARQGRSPATAMAQAESCWFGVGLRGQQISKALPLDVLQMVFAQETVRRTLGLSRSHILIADTNARAVGDDALRVQRLRRRVKDTLVAVCAAFAFPVTVFFSSEMSDAARVRDEAVAMGVDNPYVSLQLAQMEHMRRRGATIKIGWAMRGGRNDERHFDNLYLHHYDHPLGFIYTHGGRSLWRPNSRCCPYVCERPDHRLLLDRGERIEAKLKRREGSDPDLVRGYRRLLARLARSHRALVDASASGDPIHRMQKVIDALPALS